MPNVATSQCLAAILHTSPGWKLYAVAAEDPFKKLQEREGTVTLESRHNYLDNMDVYEEVHIPGARALQVAFSQRSSTERNYDYVR